MGLKFNLTPEEEEAIWNKVEMAKQTKRIEEVRTWNQCIDEAREAEISQLKDFEFCPLCKMEFSEPLSEISDYGYTDGDGDFFVETMWTRYCEECARDWFTPTRYMIHANEIARKEKENFKTLDT